MTDAAKGSILKLMSKVLGAQFAGSSWDGWRVILKAMFALPFEDGELRDVREADEPHVRAHRSGP